MNSKSKKYERNEKSQSVEEVTILYQSKSDLETEKQDDFRDELPE